MGVCTLGATGQARDEVWRIQPNFPPTARQHVQCIEQTETRLGALVGRAHWDALQVQVGPLAVYHDICGAGCDKLQVG